jgi:hypothetical protein
VLHDGNAGERIGILTQYPDGGSLPVGHGVKRPVALVSVSLGVGKPAYKLLVDSGSGSACSAEARSRRRLTLLPEILRLRLHASTAGAYSGRLLII